MLRSDGIEIEDSIRKATVAAERCAESAERCVESADRLAATIEKYFSEGSRSHLSAARIRKRIKSDKHAISSRSPNTSAATVFSNKAHPLS